MKVHDYYYCEKGEKKASCVEWVEKYLKDCVCSRRDGVSLGLGLVSMACWATAEIPQIITNFRTKSTHGVSLLYLLTWVIGDVFNLVGCLLEPSTLPTQFYTALLYTTTTIILMLQGVYYDYVCNWSGSRTIEANLGEDNSNSTLLDKLVDSKPSTALGPVEVPRGRDFYYRSARYFATSSDSSPRYSYLRVVRSGPSALDLNRDSSSDDDTLQHSPKKEVSQPRRIPRSVSRGTFIATSASLPLHGKSMMLTLAGRSLVQGDVLRGDAFGQWLGWLMTVIYVGGLIPQILLNIKRKSVEGLNPLMFVFGLIANVTYVGSILVRSMEWAKINSNLPWLVDGAICVVLEIVILAQFIYYGYIMQEKQHDLQDYFKIDEDAK